MAVEVGKGKKKKERKNHLAAAEGHNKTDLK